jgi:predicted DNA-binding protein (MmcQ/YjbR family)
MSRKLVNAICRTFPGAEVSDPWGGGHDAWKVGGKMFACIGAVMPGVSVKTDSLETAQMLIDAGVGIKAPYFHRSWVNLPWGTPRDELRYRLTASYKLVRSSLTKKVQAELDAVLRGAPPVHPIGRLAETQPPPRLMDWNFWRPKRVMSGCCMHRGTRGRGRKRIA